MRRVHAADRETADEAEREWASDGPDPLGAVLCAERAGLVARAIAGLPLAQREAVLLFEYEDLSLEEIAQVTGSEAGAVKSRLFRARETLRRRLAPLLAAPAAGSSR
jgi:RNA polymerase sigma-70 factor (ECF subfamily)